MRLDNRVAIVTGASRGVGKGIALELIEAGAKVYITGRSVEDMEYIDGKGVAVKCDHRDDAQVEAVFNRVADEDGRLDILVNNVWGGYENMIENGQFTWPLPFWQQPVWRWDAMFQAGVRAHYVASRLAAQMMVAARQGLIVNISFWAAQKHIGNVAYGVSKAATDKMTADMAEELKGAQRSSRFALPRIGEDGKGYGGGGLAGPEQFRVAAIYRARGCGARR